MTWRIPAGAIALAAVAGGAAAFSPYLTVGAVVGMAVLWLSFLLPTRVLLFGYLLITLSGFRPLPPILGFHVQAQYFLIPALFLRSLTANIAAGEDQGRWRPLVRASTIFVGVSLISLVEAVLANDTPVTTVIGNYVAWVMVFVALVIMIRLARNQESGFGYQLYSDLVDVLGIFAAFTLVTGILHFQSFSEPGTTRLALANLNANGTGNLISAATLLTIAPPLLSGTMRRSLLWLPVLLPLLVLTGSRESLGALGIGLIILLFHLRSAGAVIRYLFVLAAGGVGVLTTLTTNPSIVPHSLMRTIYFPEITPYLNVFGIHLSTPLAERLYIQVTAFHQFLHHPLLGAGFNRGLAIPEGMNLPDWWGPPLILKVAQDAFITVAAQMGIVGFIPYVGLLGVCLAMTFRAARLHRGGGQAYGIAVGTKVTAIILIFESLQNEAIYQDFGFRTVFFTMVIIAILLQGVPAARAVPATSAPESSGQKRRRVPLRIVAPFEAGSQPLVFPGLRPANSSSVPIAREGGHVPAAPRTVAVAAAPASAQASTEPIQSRTSSMVERTRVVFLRNVFSSWVSRIVTMAMSFIITPIVFHGLGPEAYGLWAVGLTLTGYLALIDVGVIGGLVRAISVAHAQGKPERISQVTATAFAFYTILGAVLVGAVYLLRTWLAAVLGVPHHLLADTGTLFVGVTVVMALDNLIVIFNQVFTALEKIHLNALVTVLWTAMTSLGTVMALVVFHAGIAGLVWASILTNLLALVLAGVLSRRVCRAVTVNPRRISTKSVGEIATLSLAMQLSNIAGTVNISIDQLILASMVGLSSAGIYELGGRLASIIWTLSWLVAGAAFPVVSRLSHENPDAIRPFYLRAERYLQMTSCGLAAGLIVIAPWVVSLWLGHGYGRLVEVAQILAVSSAAMGFTQVAKVTLWGLKRVKEMTIFELWRLCAHVTLSTLLVWRFGFNGALAGALIAITLPAMWLIWIAHRRLGISNATWLREAVGGPLLAAFVAAAVAMLFIHLVAVPIVGTSTRAHLAGLTLLSGSLFLLVYLFMLVRFGALADDDLRMMRRGGQLLRLRRAALSGAGD
jgi:O-antigen/teichoic acid export membrane protein